MIDDRELARRSLMGMGECLAMLGASASSGTVIRRADAVGARLPAVGENPWFNAAVVPLDASTPSDDPTLPWCLWTVADSAGGRVERADLATPCMGIELGARAPDPPPPEWEIEAPALAALGRVNGLAYSDDGESFSRLIGGVEDERIPTYGIRAGGQYVAVAMTLLVGDDLSVQYVATDREHRRRGLASALLSAALAAPRSEGATSATLQASPDGLPVYERLGFRRLATLRAHVRPPA